MTTKIVAVASDESTALAFDVVPGQAHEAPRLKPLLARTMARLRPTAPALSPADPVSPPVPPVRQLVGDKAYGGQPQREACAELGVVLVSPSKKNAVHPVPLDKAAYRQRNRIERLFAKIKEFRRVATRYEKLKETFVGLLHLVFGFVRLKAINIVNRA